jgi:hypothetical protein
MHAFIQCMRALSIKVVNSAGWEGFACTVFERLAERLVAEILNAADGHCLPTEVVVGFRCKSGRHRAVACGELISEAIRSIGIPTAVEHRSMQRGYRPCCGCPVDCVNLWGFNASHMESESTRRRADGNVAQTRVDGLFARELARAVDYSRYHGWA